MMSRVCTLWLYFTGLLGSIKAPVVAIKIQIFMDIFEGIGILILWVALYWREDFVFIEFVLSRIL